MTLDERFWSKVLIGETCWTWTSTITASGYGHFRLGSRRIRAHRFAYAGEVGEIPRGKFVLHRCDVPACVRPSHLWIGDDLDNVRDCARKGRRNVPSRSGRNHWASRLDVARHCSACGQVGHYISTCSRGYRQ